jgi:hypothetical protein
MPDPNGPAYPIAVRRPNAGEALIEIEMSDGTTDVVPDPDGSVEAEAQQLVSAARSGQIAPTPTQSVETQPAYGGAAEAPAAAPPAEVTRPPTPDLTQQSEMSPPAMAAQGEMTGVPGTDESPAAASVAALGIDPQAMRRQPGGAGGGTPAEQSVAAVLGENAPGGLVNSGYQAQRSGPSAADAARVRDQATRAQGLREQGIEQDVAARRAGVEAGAEEDKRVFMEAWTKGVEAIGQEGAAQAAKSRTQAKLREAEAVIPKNPMEDAPGWFVALSVIGGLASGLASGASGGRIPDDFASFLQGIVRDSVKRQVDERDFTVRQLEKQLGDQDAAISMLSARSKEALASQIGARKRFAQTEMALGQLTALESSLKAEAANERAGVEIKLMGNEAESLAFAQPKPVKGGAPLNDVTAALKALGITVKDWQKGLATKVMPGEGGATIAQSATAVKQIDSDQQLVKALAQANGGNLAGKGVVNIPGFLVATAARLGIKQGMSQDEAGQLLKEYVTTRARSYGGPITESDLSAAAEEIGGTTAGLQRFMVRLRKKSDDAIRAGLVQQFPGASNEVFAIFNQQFGITSGVAPLADVEPFEVEGAEPTPLKTPEEEAAAADKQHKTIRRNMGGVRN